jgi:protein SCO1/2
MQNWKAQFAPSPEHQKDLPSRWIPVACVVFVLGLVGLTFPVTYSMMTAPNPMAAMMPTNSNFNLIDDQGKPVTNRSWPGKYLFLYFGYTHCPDICPTTLATMAQSMQALGGTAREVQPLFITIDPRRDTPGVLRAYTKLFAPNLVGLTGSADAISHAAMNYGVQYAREGQAATTSSGYEMSHTANVYLVAPDGAIAAVMPPGMTAQAMAADLASHLTQTASR